MFFNISTFLFFISLTCFTITTRVNLGLNILKLFWQKKKKGLSQKRSSFKVFCKMKFMFCKATKLDNL